MNETSCYQDRKKIKKKKKKQAQLQESVGIQDTHIY